MSPATTQCNHGFRGCSTRKMALGCVVWVLLGTAAPGATTAPASPPNTDFQPRLNESVYQPNTTRDPFLKSGQSNGLSPSPDRPTDPTNIHLDGFLGSTNNLSAIVNGWVLNLNKPIQVETASGRLQIKAIRIALDGVVLEVDGKRVELKRATEGLPPKPPE